jgi:hypothetical protein
LRFADRAYSAFTAISLLPSKVVMDATSHVPDVKLFHYLIHAMPLTRDERDHLGKCSFCQSVIEQFETYIDPEMIHAA